MWDWLDDHGLALQGLGGAAAVIAAIVAVFTLVRASADSATRTRPYLVAEYRVPELFERRLYLVIRNAGPSAAREVRVSFDPAFSVGDDNRPGAARVARRYGTTIPTLAPGQELVSPLRIDLNDESVNEVPSQLSVRVRYGARRWPVDASYEDDFVLTHAVFVEHVFTESSESVRGRLKKIAEWLEKLTKQQQRLAPALVAIAGAVSESGRVGAPEHPGVYWSLRYKFGDTFELENYGDTTARAVEISASDSLGPVSAVRGGPDVSPGGSMTFMAARHLGTRDDTITVAWHESLHPQTPPRRKEWSRRLPAGS